MLCSIAASHCPFIPSLTPCFVPDSLPPCQPAVGHYIKERTKNAQFVIISLRNNMFELADRLVGIYKTDNTTKTVTINPSSFVVGGAAAAQRQQQAAEQEQRQQQAMQIAVA
jgi:structural maintenance of chromosome 4